MTRSVRADAVWHILSTVEAAGLGTDELLRLARVRRRQLDADRVPVGAVHAIWASAARHGREALPTRVADGLLLDQLGTFGFAVLTAPTALDALRVAASRYAEISEAGRVAVRVQGSRVCLDWTSAFDRDAGAGPTSEASLAHFVHGVRQQIGDVSPRRVAFAHDAPRYARGLEAWFRCGVEFGAARTSVVYDRAALEEHPRLANAAMHSHFLSSLRAEARRGGPVERAQRALEDDPTLDADGVARVLGVSPRTLRRRLRDRGTSLRAVRDEVRADRLRALLADPSRGLTDIACELGFSDQSALGRACRRWLGASPTRIGSRG